MLVKNTNKYNKDIFKNLSFYEN